MQIDYDLYRTMRHTLASTLDPVTYLGDLGFDCYPWQKEVLYPYKRLILKCPRQSGKSTIIATKAGHKCKHQANSLVLLFAPTENQATELMEKIGVFLSQDPEIVLERNSTVEKRFQNGSRIRAFTANPTSARGYSNPDMIIFDEAAYVEDELYLTVRPMMTGGKTELILLSTPNGKRGFFFETWTAKNEWKKIQVDVPDILHAYMPSKYPFVDYEKKKQQFASHGVSLFMSPRHTKGFLAEELDVLQEHWYRQEYCGEFLDAPDSVFDFDTILRSVSADEPAMDLDGITVAADDSKAMWR